MRQRRITGAVVIILLLTSIVSSIYLALQQKISKTIIPIKIETISLSKKPSIGVVEIYGPIYSPFEESGFISQSNLQEILDTLKKFREEKKIKAVILRINSPGGTIGAVQEINQEIHRLKKAGKPVVASVSDLAASGGYYIASVCNEVVANSGSIIGSIGVIFTSSDFSGLMKKLGVNMEIIKSGPYKDVGSFHRPFSRDEKKFLQELIDDAYKQFVTVVSNGRNLPVDTVKKLAKGQLYTGRRAKELNLVDTLGDFVTAKKRTEELAGIKDARLVKQPHYLGWKNILKLLNQKRSLSNILGRDKFTGIAYIYKP